MSLLVWVYSFRPSLYNSEEESCLSQRNCVKEGLQCRLYHVSIFTQLVFLFLQVYFGASAARYYLAFNAVGINCMTGMSYLIDKVELDRANGLAWYGRFLAEDFFLSKMLHEKYELF